MCRWSWAVRRPCLPCLNDFESSSSLRLVNRAGEATRSIRKADLWVGECDRDAYTSAIQPEIPVPRLLVLTDNLPTGSTRNQTPSRPAQQTHTRSIKDMAETEPTATSKRAADEVEAPAVEPESKKSVPPHPPLAELSALTLGNRAKATEEAEVEDEEDDAGERPLMLSRVCERWRIDARAKTSLPRSTKGGPSTPVSCGDRADGSAGQQHHPRLEDARQEGRLQQARRRRRRRRRRVRGSPLFTDGRTHRRRAARRTRTPCPARRPTTART